MDTARLVPGMVEESYRQHPALSSTTARRLIRSTPAHVRWQLDNPKEPTPAILLGTAVHSLVLGEGQPVAHLEFDSWRGNAVKEAAAEARAAGRLPLLTDDYRAAMAMADALRLHRLAGPLLEAAPLREVSGFWTDDETQVDCRVRFDAVGELAGVPIVIDVKTTASLAQFAKAVDEKGYDQQAAWYSEAATVLGLADGWPDFVFACVESAPPYAAFVRRVPQWLERGHLRNRRAREMWAACTTTGEWPAYPIEIEDVPMPRWASAS